MFSVQQKGHNKNQDRQMQIEIKGQLEQVINSWCSERLHPVILPHKTAGKEIKQLISCAKTTPPRTSKLLYTRLQIYCNSPLHI